MEVAQTPISGCLLITPDVYQDARGIFLELYRQTRYAEQGVSADFVQDNFSRSTQGTLRGLHYQLQNPQGKLVQVLQGEVFDVAVDLRRSSPTFGQAYCVRLSAENHWQLYVPPGCAHGFYVLSEQTDFVYKCTMHYVPDDERVLLWNDPALAIPWPLLPGISPLLSPKDQQGLPLAECEVYP